MTVVGFNVNSTAKNAGLNLFNSILEVEGSPVGFIRKRYYEPYRFYSRLFKNTTQLLVSFVTENGNVFYYPEVQLTPIHEVPTVQYSSEVIPPPPDGFFTMPQPKDRGNPEDKVHNLARYVFGRANFANFSRFELGVDVDYSNNNGATIQTVKDGKPAADAKLQVRDSILEVNGAPVGQFGDRLYEIWRQFVFLPSARSEFLVQFQDPATGESRFYYPVIILDDLAGPG